jgi:hypothetical protein
MEKTICKLSTKHIQIGAIQNRYEINFVMQEHEGAIIIVPENSNDQKRLREFWNDEFIQENIETITDED